MWWLSSGSFSRRRSATRHHSRFAASGVSSAKAVPREEGDRLPPAPGGMRPHLAPEVHPASLPGGREHARDRRLDPLVRVRDDEFDPVEPATDQAAEELGPRRRRLGGADLEPEHLALTPLVDPVSRFAAKPIISRRKSPSAAFATSACRSIISSVSGNLQSGLVSTTPILPERPGDRRARVGGRRPSVFRAGGRGAPPSGGGPSRGRTRRAAAGGHRCRRAWRGPGRGDGSGAGRGARAARRCAR